MPYPSGDKSYIPNWPDSEANAVTVTADDKELLALMFGDHADEAAEIIREADRRPVRYVQIAPKPKEEPMDKELQTITPADVGTIAMPDCSKGHDKCFSPDILRSFPPQVKWICRDCGQRGADTMDHTRTKAGEYEELDAKYPEKK